MATEYIGGYCETCQAQRKFERKSPNHILHLLITVILGAITLGIGAVIWIIVWILLSIQFKGWICSTCGSPKDKEVKINYFKLFIFVFIALVVISFISNLNKTNNNKIEKTITKEDVDISTKYEIISDKLTKEECTNKAIDYIISKAKGQTNIDVLNETFIPKEKYLGTINIIFIENQIKKSFTGSCIKQNGISIKELETIIQN